MSQTGYIPLPDCAVITIAGEDAASFLQGLITIDSIKKPVNSAGYGCLLTPQGKYLHDFFLLRDSETGFRIETDATRAAELLRRLSMFRLRAKVVLELTAPQAAVFALFGTPIPAGLSGYADPRRPEMGWRIIADDADAAMARLDRAGLQKLPLSAYEQKRLALGLPDGARDLEPERSTMLEGNLDQLGAVDWQKGCYMGQELTARTRYRGLIKKRLVPLIVSGPLPAHGTPVLLDGTNVGETRSGFGDQVLALIKLEAIETTRDDRREFTIGDASARLALPDWLRVEPEEIGTKAKS